MYDCVVGKSSCHKACLVGIDLLHKDFLYCSLVALYDLSRDVLDLLKQAVENGSLRRPPEPGSA